MYISLRVLKSSTFCLQAEKTKSQNFPHWRRWSIVGSCGAQISCSAWRSPMFLLPRMMKCRSAQPSTSSSSLLYIERATCTAACAIVARRCIFLMGERAVCNCMGARVAFIFYITIYLYTAPQIKDKPFRKL